MLATERSRQNLRLAGAVLLVIAGRIYLSSGGAEAMVFTPPRLDSRYEAQTLLAYAALAVAVSAAIAAAGKRWVGRLASVGMGGVAGLLAISQYNAILGAIIGLGVGMLVACGVFRASLIAFARVVAALAFGIACGAAALSVQRDLSGGPGVVVLLLMAATLVAAAFVIFRRSRKAAAVEWKRRWLRRLGRASLLLFVVFGLWVSLSVDMVRRVNRVGFQGNVTPFTPQLSWLWRGFVKPTWIYGSNNLTDAELTELRNFGDLEFLDFSHSHISDIGLGQIRGLPRLRYVYLRETRIKGDGFENLATLPALAQLVLDDTQTSDENVVSLRKLAGLRSLSLKNTPISDAAMAPIGKLVTLRSLNLSGTKITDAGMSQLAALASLSQLELSQTQITGDGLQHLAPLAWLEELDLSQTQITDANLERLPALPRLERLRLDGTKVTDAGLAHLKKQPVLHVVDAYETAVTAKGAEQFCKTMQQRTTKPECFVNR